jgi:hypothetical protein
MAQKSAAPRILAVLRPYLEEKMARWLEQPWVYSVRTATLPVTKTGKLDVKEVVSELTESGLKPNDLQHFYKNREIKQVLNAAALQQGIAGIGIKVIVQDISDQRLRSLISANRRHAAALGQKIAELVLLREENSQLRKQILKMQTECKGNALQPHSK